jgi:hypothetical protein
MGFLLGCILHLPVKAADTSNDQEVKSPVKTELLPEEFRVFPNPVLQQKFTIESTRLPLTEIRISNIAGKPVYHKKLNPAVTRFEVMANELPPGIYLLNIKTSDHSSKTVKLLINGER